MLHLGAHVSHEVGLSLEDLLDLEARIFYQLLALGQLKLGELDGDFLLRRQSLELHSAYCFLGVDSCDLA